METPLVDVPHALLPDLFHGVWSGARDVEVALREMDWREQRAGNILAADICHLPRGMRNGWQRRLRGWQDVEPDESEEATHAEVARVQAMAFRRVEALEIEPGGNPLAGAFLPPPPRRADGEPKTRAAEWAGPQDALAWLDQGAALASRASELLELHWGTSAQGPFECGPDGRLSIAWPAAQKLAQGRDLALREWVQTGRPGVDLARYRTPVPPREGAVAARGQMAHPSSKVRREAIAAAGLPFPMVVPFPEPMLHQAQGAAWRERRIRMPRGLLGVPAYPGAEDPWLHWSAWGHPGGIIVGAVIPPEGVLHVGDPDRLDEHHRFWQVHAQALSVHGEGEATTVAMREALLADGISAVARHDLRAATHEVPQEVWLLRAEPPTLYVLSESLSP